MIIAEAGVNHNGSPEIARSIIDACVDAGADAVKFQTFRPEELATAGAGMARYQVENTGRNESQLDMLRRLSLSEDDHIELRNYCRRRDIIFCSSAFDPASVEFLSSLGLPFWKIPSGEITNVPYLRAIGRLNESIILSTGMANLAEVETAIGVLVESGTEHGRITLLHCHTEYPTRPEDVNLNCIRTLKSAFGLPVGYSDHTEGIAIPIAAVAMGASVIEKHVTIDRTLEGPDQKASADPSEFQEMVEGIRSIEAGLGTGIKAPTERELLNLSAARKSIVAGRPIPKGKVLEEEDLSTKRPGTGLSASLWDLVIGTKAIRDYEKDEFIELHD